MTPSSVTWRRRLAKTQCPESKSWASFATSEVPQNSFEAKGKPSPCRLPVTPSRSLCSFAVIQGIPERAGTANGPFAAVGGIVSPTPGLVPSLLPCSSLPGVTSFSCSSSHYCPEQHLLIISRSIFLAVNYKRVGAGQWGPSEGFWAAKLIPVANDGQITHGLERSSALGKHHHLHPPPPPGLAGPSQQKRTSEEWLVAYTEILYFHSMALRTKKEKPKLQIDIFFSNSFGNETRPKPIQSYLGFSSPFVLYSFAVVFDSASDPSRVLYNIWHTHCHTFLNSEKDWITKHTLAPMEHSSV